jgi:20S proteasome subunit beta 7
MSAADAEALLKDALRVCYYRDKQSINKFQIATVTGEGVKIGEAFALETSWDLRAFAAPTKWAIGAW